MQLEKINIKIKCDIPGCINYADYTLKLKKFWNIGNTNFCKGCLTKIGGKINKELTPKSPKSVFKSPKKIQEKKEKNETSKKQNK